MEIGKEQLNLIWDKLPDPNNYDDSEIKVLIRIFETSKNNNLEVPRYFNFIKRRDIEGVYSWYLKL